MLTTFLPESDLLFFHFPLCCSCGQLKQVLPVETIREGVLNSWLKNVREVLAGQADGTEKHLKMQSEVDSFADSELYHSIVEQAAQAPSPEDNATVSSFMCHDAQCCQASWLPLDSIIPASAAHYTCPWRHC